MSEAAPPTQLPPIRRPGTVLDSQWRIDEKLGEGGMSSVYAATHVTSGQRAAIKLLHDNLVQHAELVQRFLREGLAANKVAHAGIVKVLDQATGDDGVPYLVVELLRGQTLEQRRNLLGGRMPIQDALRYLDDALDALAHAHDAGVIHRDLKPDNLFITNDGVVKILDFGLARLLDQVGGIEHTQAGVAIGTPEFMAPEQAKARRAPVDERADVWGMGATFFMLVSGRYVHNELTLQEQLAANAGTPAQSLSRVAPFVPRPIVLVIDKALSLEKENRFPDARALRAALRAAASTCGLDGTDEHKTLPIGTMRVDGRVSLPEIAVERPMDVMADEAFDERPTLHGPSSVGKAIAAEAASSTDGGADGEGDAMATLALARSPATDDEDATLVPGRVSLAKAPRPVTQKLAVPRSATALVDEPKAKTPREPLLHRLPPTTWVLIGVAVIGLFVLGVLVGLGLHH